MRLVQQVVHSFFVDLKVGAVDGELLATRATLLLNHFKEHADRPGHDSLVFTRLDHGDRLALIIAPILVPLHRECFAGACLAIGEDGRVVALLENAQKV